MPSPLLQQGAPRGLDDPAREGDRRAASLSVYEQTESASGLFGYHSGLVQNLNKSHYGYRPGDSDPEAWDEANATRSP
jgi:hypothetical protein